MPSNDEDYSRWIGTWERSRDIRLITVLYADAKGLVGKFVDTGKGVTISWEEFNEEGIFAGLHCAAYKVRTVVSLEEFR
jgi:hypothetical protein